MSRSAKPQESPVQVMVPAAVKRQLAIMSAERGESLRTLMLLALREIGLDIPDDELIDRRKRRNRTGDRSNGAQ